MAQPNVRRALVREPRKVYQRAVKKRGGAVGPAFAELTEADYAVLRAQLEEALRPRPRGRPRGAAQVKAERITPRPARTCATEGCAVPVAPRCTYCDTHADLRERTLRREQMRRYREQKRQRRAA
jgi:hypothetical protein